VAVVHSLRLEGGTFVKLDQPRVRRIYEQYGVAASHCQALERALKGLCFSMAIMAKIPITQPQANRAFKPVGKMMLRRLIRAVSASVHVDDALETRLEGIRIMRNGLMHAFFNDLFDSLGDATTPACADAIYDASDSRLRDITATLMDAYHPVDELRKSITKQLGRAFREQELERAALEAGGEHWSICF
jgi:hypothetical protein